MRTKIGRLSIVFVTILLLAGLLPVIAFSADGSLVSGLQQNGDDLVTNRSEAAESAASSGWTLERMRNAKPMPLPELEGRADSAGSIQPAGRPGLISGGPEGLEYSLGESLASVERFASPSDSPAPADYSYPPPYTRYENFDKYRKYPYRTVGVLFFSLPWGDFRCSASSIGNYAVWTAGHCVSDGAGTWASDWLFVPGYLDGNPLKPWAQWTGDVAWTLVGWHNNGDLAFDMGGVVLNPANGKKVSVVGWLGFAWNWPRDQHWHQIGYPAATPFDGNRMNICTSSRAKDDTNFSPATVGTGCDMTGGSSGGPWVKDFAGFAGASNYLNGNVSYIYIVPDEPEQMYSPYFDDTAKGLWDALIADVP